MVTASAGSTVPFATASSVSVRRDSNRDRRRGRGAALTTSSRAADPSMPGTIVAAPRRRPLGGRRQPVTVIVPFMPEPTWNVQMNVYVPGDRLIVAVPDWPGGFTTLIPLP